jgi:YHS domain-containing protein
MKLLVLIIIVYLAYRAVKSWLLRNLQVPGQGYSKTPSIDDVMIKDPVCGIYFPRREGVELQQEGKTYVFCSTECRDRFLKNNG